jgi:hypothetical protein
MRALVALTLLIGLARADDSIPGAAPVRRPLVTRWPAKIDCERFAELDLTVSDEIDRVDWQGATGAPRAIALTRSTGSDASDWFEQRSKMRECDEERSCIVYPSASEGCRGSKVAHAREPLAADFPSPKPATLVLHRGALPPTPWRVMGCDGVFGASLALRCSDAGRASLRWICDANGCVLRSHRDNPRGEGGVAGDYRARWANGDRAALVELAKAPPRALRGAKLGALTALARDLARELTTVIDAGCDRGDCSRMVGEVAQAARTLSAATSLRLRDVQAQRDDPDHGESTARGFVARLGAADAPALAEVACSWQVIHVGRWGDEPKDFAECRLSLFAGAIRAVDYYPDWFQQVQFPDGGGIHLDESTDGKYGTHRPQIELVGSALELAGD